MSNDQNGEVPASIEGGPVADNTGTEASWAQLECRMEKQRLIQRWVVLGLAMMGAGFFGFILYKMVSKCFNGEDAVVVKLLATNGFAVLFFTLPLLAIVTIMWFLMHYIFGHQGGRKKQDSIKSPPLEALEMVNNFLSHIKDILPFIKKGT